MSLERPASEVVELSGRLIELALGLVLDAVRGAGASYRIEALEVGATEADAGQALIEVTAPSGAVLDALLIELQAHGANRARPVDAELAAADRDGVLPAGFALSSASPTAVRLDGEWLPVDNPAGGCALVVGVNRRVRAVPVHRVKAGDRVVIGHDGIRVEVCSQPVTDRHQLSAARMRNVAERLAAARHNGRVLAVCGADVVVEGASPALAALVAGGWVDVLVGSNAFGACDAEANVMGSAMGVDLATGRPMPAGRTSRLRVVNEVRRYGSLAAAVAAGYLDGGVLFECVTRQIPFVLAGQLGDDGPLPDVLTDALEAADAIRYLLPGVAAALLLGSDPLVSAVGRLLPASVEVHALDGPGLAIFSDVATTFTSF